MQYKDYYDIINASINNGFRILRTGGQSFRNKQIMSWNSYSIPFGVEARKIYITNKSVDKLGMFTSVSKILSDANINIANLTLGRNLKQNDVLNRVNLNYQLIYQLKNLF